MVSQWVSELCKARKHLKKTTVQCDFKSFFRTKKLIFFQGDGFLPIFFRCNGELHFGPIANYFYLGETFMI